MTDKVQPQELADVASEIMKLNRWTYRLGGFQCGAAMLLVALSLMAARVLLYENPTPWHEFAGMGWLAAFACTAIFCAVVYVLGFRMRVQSRNIVWLRVQEASKIGERLARHGADLSEDGR